MKRLLVLSVFALSACVPPSSPSQTKATEAVSPVLGRTEVPIRTLQQGYLDAADGLSLDTKEACAESICGAPPSNVNDADSQARTSEIAARWKGLIERSAIASTESSRLELDKVVANRDAIATAQLPPTYAAMVNLFWSLQYFSAGLPAWKGKSFDSKELHEKLKSRLSEADITAFDHMLTAFLTNPELSEAAEMSVLGLRTFFEKKTNSKDPTIVRAELTKTAKNVVSRLKEMHAAFPGLPFSLEPEVEALARGEEVDGVGSDLFVSAYREAAFDKVFKKDLAVFTERTPDLKKDLDVFMTTSLPVLKKRLAAGDLLERVRKRTDACSTVAKNLVEIQKSEAAAKAGADMLVASVRSASATVAQRLSTDPAIRAKLSELVSKIQFELPESTAMATKKIETAFARELSDAQSSKESITKADSISLALYVEAAILSASKDDPETGEVCTKHDPKDISDHAVSSMGLVSISWPSLIEPAGGSLIIAHEFGHVVSSFMKSSAKSAFADSYACVLDRKSGQNQEITQEEDFADLFGAQVANELEKTSFKTESHVCLMMRNFGSQNRWNSQRGLAMIWPSVVRDVHSPELYRLVQTEINRGHALNASCSSVAAAAYPKMTNQCSF